MDESFELNIFCKMNIVSEISYAKLLSHVGLRYWKDYKKLWAASVISDRDLFSQILGTTSTCCHRFKCENL